MRVTSGSVIPAQKAAGNMINDGKPVDLGDPLGTMQIPVYISPQGVQQMLQGDRKQIYLNIIGPTNP